MNSIQDKRLKMPIVDLKKKPTYELLSLIGKQASQDITPHPFTKLKKPKEDKIEEVFIKTVKKEPIKQKPKPNNKKNNKKNLQSKSNKKKI